MKAATPAARIALRVTPDAPHTKVDGLYNEAIRIRIKAPPVDGKANAALLEFLSKQLGVPRNALSIHSGAASRNKVVLVSGLSQGRNPVPLVSRRMIASGI